MNNANSLWTLTSDQFSDELYCLIWEKPKQQQISTGKKLSFDSAVLSRRGRQAYQGTQAQTDKPKIQEQVQVKDGQVFLNNIPDKKQDHITKKEDQIIVNKERDSPFLNQQIKSLNDSKNQPAKNKMDLALFGQLSYRQSLEFHISETQRLPLNLLANGEQDIGSIQDPQDKKKKNIEDNIPVRRRKKKQERPQQIMAEEKQEANGLKRNDAKDLSQNIRSKSITIYSQLLSDDMGIKKKQGKKALKKTIFSQFNKFLKKKKAKVNSVIALVFVYLYFLQQGVNTFTYYSFQVKMHNYLDKRMSMAKKKEDKLRNVLEKKIQANKDLLDYLFTLKGEPVTLQALRGMSDGLLSTPSEKNKQTKQLDNQLNQAMQIYMHILEEHDSLRQTTSINLC